jgi:AcrR family transcriptional regulator
MSEPKIETWIKAGYNVLSTEGLEGLKVERLARTLRLNKSAFYYYFGSMKGYVRSLMKHHVLLAQAIEADIKDCKNIDPDLLLLIVKHKEFFLVQSQMLVKAKPAHSFEDLDEAVRITSEAVLPLLKKESELPGHSAVALAFMNMLRHFFYAQIDSKNITYQFLHKMTSEAKDVLNKVVDEKQGSSRNQ